MKVESAVAALIEEAEQPGREQAWDLTPGNRDLALATAAGLSTAIGDAHHQQALPDIQRLAHLREALAALAMALAGTHGRLAWFLAACIEALSPVLHWRALPADDGPAFHTTYPAPGQFADAENAVREMAAALTRIAA
ncbi:hypothetical protein [Streptomyces sp. NRRL F-2664]|uniref:hypothetical protein n=1 Tax=Streptomyces sp. NRRL F-2664 TaxID=1463842 RepID=UPI0004C73439|nr:hypothetical protein [Streptomyces sp. NRRL F-2664]